MYLIKWVIILSMWSVLGCLSKKIQIKISSGNESEIMSDCFLQPYKTLRQNWFLTVGDLGRTMTLVKLIELVEDWESELSDALKEIKEIKLKTVTTDDWFPWWRACFA